MKSMVRMLVLAGTLAAAGVGRAQDQVPWVADFRQACEQAAQQKRLVLLHFYSDDCPPCVRVEQNVFSRPEVAQAIARNYVPVKVHAGQNPDLVNRYQVTRWPTDVAVTPAGLEVHRSTSPQLPEHYVELVDLMALKAGVGTGRQWTENMRQLGQATLDEAAGNAQGLATQGQQQWNQLGQQFQAGADQAQAGAEKWSQQAQEAARQFNQQTQTAVEQYQQQTQGAVQQYREQAQGTAQQWNQQAAETVQQFGQQTQAAGQQAQNTAQQFAEAGRSTINSWQTGLDLRAPINSGAAAAAALPPQTQPQVGPYNAPSPPAAAANPYLGPPLNAPSNAQSTWQPPASQPPAAPPPAAPQFVAASEAPPVSLEGYCPVTLVEMKKWRKADPQFGAVHRGRTYLFATAVEQKKFLANPDGYAPVLSGYDAVRFAKTGQLVEGSRAFGNSYKNRLFLFADEAARAEFEKSPEAFAQPAYQAMLRSETTYR